MMICRPPLRSWHHSVGICTLCVTFLALKESRTLELRITVYQLKGTLSGIETGLSYLKSVLAEHEVEALQYVVKRLGAIMYCESADLIDGGVNGLPENDPEYYYNLLGKYYAWGNMRDMIQEVIDRNSRSSEQTALQ